MHYPARSLLSSLALLLGLLASSLLLQSAPVTLWTEDFQAGTDGAAPSAVWTASGNWKTRQHAGGANKFVVNEDATGSPSRTLTRSHAQSVDSLCVDFGYDWRFGGNPQFGYGHYSLVVSCSLLDGSGLNGYRLRVHQGSSGDAANDGRIFELYRLDNNVATLLPGGQGPGYNLPGWQARALSGPDFKRVRLVRDVDGRLTAYRDLGTGYEAVVSVVDATYKTFAQTMVSAAGYGVSEQPAFDNLTLTRPGRLHWGVNGHPDFSSSPSYYSAVPLAGSSSTSSVGQLDLLQELGANYYRVGVFSEVKLDQLLPLADARGIKLLPLISRSGNIYDPARSLTDVYTASYDKGRAFGLKYAGRFTHVELDNELELDCIKGASYAGTSPADYDDFKYQCVMTALKGLADGVRSGDPALQRIINAGWYHYGFHDRLIADGVPFEVIGWHWYSQMGALSRIMQKLSSYGKPIWITEVNRRDGSYSTAPVLNETFTADTTGSAPISWTASGNWKIREFGSVKAAVNEDAGGASGRTLTRTFSPAISGSWELNLDYDWQWGGGHYSLIIDCDVLDDANNGYRVRIRQGVVSGPTNAANSVLSIHKVTAGTAVLIPGAEGTGYNQAGFGNSNAPQLKRVRLRRDKTNNTLSVAAYSATLGAMADTTSGADTTDGTFTKVVVTTRGYVNNERPLVDNISLVRAFVDEAAQADSLATMIAEMRNLPGVEAVFAYELLDQPGFGTFSGEAYYGLCRISKNTSGNWIFNGRKLAFDTYRAEIASHGTIPVPAGGAIIVDDAYMAPATKYALSASVWPEGSSLAGFYFDGYKHDNAANKSSANFARFYSYIPVTGSYEVAIRYPRDAANASSVPVTVHHAGGSTVVNIDQRARTTEWVVLGTFPFNAWQPGSAIGSTTWETTANAAYVEIGNGGTSGRVVADAVRFSPVSLPLVSVVATTPLAREFGAVAGVFTITRQGASTASPLAVSLAMSGTAENGADYAAVAGRVVIPAGDETATVIIAPATDTLAEGDQSVTLTLLAGTAYRLGTNLARLVVADRPLDAWRFERFTAAQLADPALGDRASDPDGDGFSNLLEYALGTNPLARDAPAWGGGVSDGHLTLTFRRYPAAVDVALIPEVSPDLSRWRAGPLAVEETVVGEDVAAGYQIIRARDLVAFGAEARRFIRLRVTPT